MPTILIKDYQWRQSTEKIIIYVPLKGHPKTVDLFVIDNYMKISFSPFLLELFLWENVHEKQSECTLTDTEAIVSLQKTNSTLDWPSIEKTNLTKQQKRELRNCLLEKTQNVLENHEKTQNEKRQYLQKEAVKLQINLDTNTLNRIESMRDAHRKAAMRDFEEWKLNMEMPILGNITGEIQENKKAYRLPLKWFKDDLGIMQVQETNQEKEEIKREQYGNSMIGKRLKETLTIEESRKQDDFRAESIIERNLEEEIRKETIIEEKLIKKLHNNKNSNKEVNVETNLKSNNLQNVNSENEEKETNISKTWGTRKITSNSSDDSELDYKIISAKSSTRPLVKEMNQQLSETFHVQRKKVKSNKDLIEKIFKNRYSKLNQIFDKSEESIPFPRRNGIINVTFSDRAFPTPARESSHVEEQEWLSKQAEARRKTGFVVEDLSPEEQDPQWLKDKGDDFFKSGNYLAAISAYTHGIKISDKMSALYVNRSATHYALGNYYRCIDDCSKVLELMEPKCERNRISRARCHARRGAALCKLSAPQHGIPELEAALKLDPLNESIKRDIYAVKRYFDIKE